MIAAEIGMPPEDFFALAYKLRRRTAKANPLVRSYLETEGAATAGSDEIIHLTRGELKGRGSLPQPLSGDVEEEQIRPHRQPLQEKDHLAHEVNSGLAGAGGLFEDPDRVRRLRVVSAISPRE
jgi:hypothetical protein